MLVTKKEETSPPFIKWCHFILFTNVATRKHIFTRALKSIKGYRPRSNAISVLARPSSQKLIAIKCWEWNRNVNVITQACANIAVAHLSRKNRFHWATEMLLRSHLNEPIVLSQTWWQSPLSVAHSSLSKHGNQRFDRRAHEPRCAHSTAKGCFSKPG